MKNILILIATYFILMSCDSRATPSHPIIPDPNRQTNRQIEVHQDNDHRDSEIEDIELNSTQSDQDYDDNGKKLYLGYDSIILTSEGPQVWSKVFLSRDKAIKSYKVFDERKYNEKHIISYIVKRENLSAGYKQYFLDAVYILYLKDSPPENSHEGPKESGDSINLVVKFYNNGKARRISTGMSDRLPGYDYELDELFVNVHYGAKPSNHK